VNLVNLPGADVDDAVNARDDEEEEEEAGAEEELSLPLLT
jgi:hypothetical protein